MLITPAAFFATFSLGFFYFVGAIPGGMASGLPAWVAALVAWFGYSSGAAVMLLIRPSARAWVARKLRIPTERDPSKWIWRAWDRFGLVGLGIVAPVTIGPQTGCLLALAIGESSLRTFLAISLGVIPWCLGITIVIMLGFKVVA